MNWRDFIKATPIKPSFLRGRESRALIWPGFRFGGDGKNRLNQGLLKREAGSAGMPVLTIAFCIIVLASAAFIATGANEQALTAAPDATAAMPATGLHLQNGLDAPYDAPQFSGITAWLNSQPLTMNGLRGKVVLVDFWTYGCINCVRTLPYVADWDKKYRDRGLVVVGVHSPEFAFEKDADNVRAAVAQHDIHYPVALDNGLDTWNNFSNRYWPAHYLINREGQVVYTHLGEGGYDATENNIRYLLGIKGGAPQDAEAKAGPGYRPGQARAPQHGAAFRDCSSCAVMVAIPAGSFEMGRKPDMHRVTIARPFALGKYEVTQAQWQAVMGNNPSLIKGASLPVEQVNWGDVQEFIARLNHRTGQSYRLPSEAEWEYACRAGRPNSYCGSDDANSVAWYGAYADASGNSGNTPHPVGARLANAFGLHDMSGNVWEWVEDAWHANYNGAPADGSEWRGDGAKRVIRGGSWLDYPLLARADFRVWAGAGKRSSDLGFRLAMTLPKQGHQKNAVKHGADDLSASH